MDRRQFLERVAVGSGIGLSGFLVLSQLTDRTPPEQDVDETPTPRGDETTTSPTVRDTTQTPGETTSATEETTSTTEELTPPPEETPVRHQDEFGTVIDAVQAGADPAGNEPIGDFLEQYAADDTLLSFPEGTYLFPEITLKKYDHLGIAAAHDEHPTFVSPGEHCSDPHARFEQVSDFLLEGIDFNFEKGNAGGSIGVITAGDATVRDVNIRGGCPNQKTTFRVDIRNPDAKGLIENLNLLQEPGNGWVTGAYVGKDHSGEVTFRNCQLNGFTDNGLYASAPGIDDGGGGAVHTEGSHFENNNVANIRLGSPGSTARGDTVVVESAPDAEAINLRGIRFRQGRDQLVENCDIRFGPDVSNSFGAIVYHDDNAGATVKNSHVTMDSDGIPAIKAFYHSGDGDTAPIFENLTIDGTASDSYAVLINGRNGTEFRNCTIEQTGKRRDGIRLAYCDDAKLIDSRIDVTGYPLILRDTHLTIRNTTFVTPNGERHIEEMEAEPGDFRPGEWN